MRPISRDASISTGDKSRGSDSGAADWRRPRCIRRWRLPGLLLKREVDAPVEDSIPALTGIERWQICHGRN